MEYGSVNEPQLSLGPGVRPNVTEYGSMKGAFTSSFIVRWSLIKNYALLSGVLRSKWDSRIRNWVRFGKNGQITTNPNPFAGRCPDQIGLLLAKAVLFRSS